MDYVKVAITGSRGIKDWRWISEQLDDIFKRFHGSYICLIVGDASGVDKIAYEWAIKNYIHFIIRLKPANKYFAQIYSKLAGSGATLYYARNMQVVDNCDYLISLWDGKSGGTKQTVEYGMKMGKTIIERQYHGC